MPIAKYLKFIDSFCELNTTKEITEDEYDEFFDDLVVACSRYGIVDTNGDLDTSGFRMSRYVSIARMINILVDGIHISKELILSMQNVIGAKWPEYLVSFDCEIDSLDISYSVAITNDLVICGYESSKSKKYLEGLRLSFET